MRITSVIVLLLIVAGIGFGAWYFFVKPGGRESVMQVVNKAKQTAEGYTPARTADEAVDKFRSAVKGRDYEAAAIYCTTDYAEQLRRATPAAQELAKAIDNLTDMMETENLKSDKVKVILKALEPFPREIKTVGGVEKQGDDKAKVTFQEDFGNLKMPDLKTEQWKVDLNVFRALAGGPFGTLGLGQPMTVPLVREGKGEEAAWKLDIPADPATKTRVDALRDNYKNYVKALQKLTTEIRTDAVTKSDLEARLKTELEEAK